MANSEAAYDIEMQTFWQAHLGKRFRFYQSVLDSKALAPREGFSKLRSSVVAFICLHDPLKGGLPRYTFGPGMPGEPRVGPGVRNAMARAQLDGMER